MSASPAASSQPNGFFSTALGEADPEIFRAIEGELGRQRDEIELIASENIVSRAVLEAQGSVMTNKYAEGYPGRRYYGGCHFVDIAERSRSSGPAGSSIAPSPMCSRIRAPGEPGRVHGHHEPRRHLHGPRPRLRRAPDPWLGRQHVGQVVQRRLLQGARGGRIIDMEEVPRSRASTGRR
jgi:hypothetical protein